MLIKLTQDEIDMCEEFSRKSAIDQQAIEFGQKDTQPRSEDKIIRDTMIGKMAEVAFSKLIYDMYKIEVSPDFNCYGKNKWDTADIILNDWRIDVKSSKPGAKWALIEFNKLNFRKLEDKISHAFVYAITNWDRKTNTTNGEVELIGFVSIRRLIKKERGVVILKKGNPLPDTKSDIKLKADNYGIKLKDLDTDWKMMFDYFLSVKPKI